MPSIHMAENRYHGKSHDEINRVLLKGIKIFLNKPEVADLQQPTRTYLVKVREAFACKALSLTICSGSKSFREAPAIKL